jgi:hypothetical protein
MTVLMFLKSVLILSPSLLGYTFCSGLKDPKFEIDFPKGHDYQKLSANSTELNKMLGIT